VNRSLAIVGAGGHGRVVADCAEALGWDRIEFFDDKGGEVASGPWAVVGMVEALFEQVGDYHGVVVGIGANRVRLDLHRALVARGGTAATLIHPRATVSRHARIEAGTVVFAGAVVNFGARIGQACIINTGATVDHDDRLADGVHLSPGAHLGGGTTVGECSWIGLGASVREGVSIGRSVRIGAGAAVVASAADDVTLVGVPARPLGPNDDA
jgi:sugar O-acyltransferase (sialic acid O-acetyltransferase NeuD family)